MGKTTNSVVYLIRHGETEWNVTGRWQGHFDVPLSAAGRAQAARLARRLTEEGVRFDALYSSDLKRAWETAAAIGGALGLAPAAAPALREIDLGRWSGKTRAEIAEAYPDEWRQLESNVDFPRGGGETFAGFLRRVLGWMESAAEKHPGATVCAVTHGGCIRAVLLHALGLTWADRGRVPAIENASVTVVERASAAWRIILVNDASSVREAARKGLREGDPEG
ncbi:MAG: histidine phosphatase family protein [Anaerolineales bacterium]|nr:histidine phosphatase family protein [Anaerolineales bacterium]